VKLIAETHAQPVKLVVDGDEAGDVRVELSVWLDHHGWQSGKGRLDGSRSQIFQALNAGCAELRFEGERFGIVINDISPGRPAHFVLSGDLPEALVGRWPPAMSPSSSIRRAVTEPTAPLRRPLVSFSH
jgi:hypothetical protein